MCRNVDTSWYGGHLIDFASKNKKSQIKAPTYGLHPGSTRKYSPSPYICIRNQPFQKSADLSIFQHTTDFYIYLHAYMSMYERKKRKKP